MLLQSKKEFVICADLKPEDVFFYYTTTYVFSSHTSLRPSPPSSLHYDTTLQPLTSYTHTLQSGHHDNSHVTREPAIQTYSNPNSKPYSTTLHLRYRRGWMMWNFLVHGLSVGCTLVLYDGSPLRDPAYLWNLVDELGITIFGTSAKYIDQLSVSVPVRGVASFLLHPCFSFYSFGVLLFCCSGICILYTRSLDPVSFSAQLKRSNAQHLFLPASLRLLLAGLAFYLCSDLCEEVGIGMKLVLVVVVSNVRRSLCALTCVSHESILWWCHTGYSRDTLSKQHQLSTLTLPLLHSTFNVER